MNEIKEKLKELAEKGSHLDEEGFSVFDWSGGNIDDAYSMGLDDGEISLARELLKMINRIDKK